MEYKYTDSAKEELERFKLEQIKQLEDFIRRRKYVYGDDLIEVTGSDIKELKRHFTIVDNRRSNYRQLMLGLYFFLGVLFLVFGLFYEQIHSAIRDNPTQLMIIVMGVSMTSASLFGNWWFKYRDRIRSERINYKNETDKMANKAQ